MPTRRNLKSYRERRQTQAQERQAHWAGLTYEQQLASLDERLGEGQGAEKQRARIAAAIAERDAPKPEKKPKPDGKPRRRRNRTRRAKKK
ncbi:MAG: hypothetical protein GTO63_05735, partial [Anaerolineae bacterium]|nr:hypothetical protein [Anaerolineae bacterium]NIN94473.1 hypothetical protein [Anaerolineae bacterium]NIQ77542.1 hypothetical protein [Anaerolineae bacterium]